MDGRNGGVVGYAPRGPFGRSFRSSDTVAGPLGSPLNDSQSTSVPTGYPTRLIEQNNDSEPENKLFTRSL